MFITKLILVGMLATRNGVATYCRRKEDDVNDIPVTPCTKATTDPVLDTNGGGKILPHEAQLHIFTPLPLLMESYINNCADCMFKDWKMKVTDDAPGLGLIIN